MCGIYPEKYKNELLKNSKNGFQFAAQNFQEAIIKGLYENSVNFSVITNPFLSTYPLGYKKVLVNFRDTIIYENVRIITSVFINVPILNFKLNSTKKNVFKWCESPSSEEKVILVYSLSWNLVKIAVEAKEKYPLIKIVVVVPDLPEFWGYNRLYNILGIRESVIKKIYSKISKFDGFVLLTDSMRDRLCAYDKKSVVVEGIHNCNLDENNQRRDRIILYTGSVNKRYGILNLIEAFNLLDCEDIKLFICGEGDASQEVIKASLTNEKIKYLGKVSQDFSLKMQKKAFLLVNPRTSEGEFTQYSFPSKIIEYFASGTCVMMYKLPGVPKEYYDYCFSLEDETIQGLSKGLKEVIKLTDEQRDEIGLRAKLFIQKNKTPKHQVRKIIDLMTNC